MSKTELHILFLVMCSATARTRLQTFTSPMCLQISEEFNVAVLVTNQVMSDPSGGAMFVVDPKKPLGGHVMAHASTVRLSLRKGKGEQRVMKLVDSPNLRKSHLPFTWLTRNAMLADSSQPQ